MDIKPLEEKYEKLFLSKIKLMPEINLLITWYFLCTCAWIQGKGQSFLKVALENGILEAQDKQEYDNGKYFIVVDESGCVSVKINYLLST